MFTSAEHTSVAEAIVRNVDRPTIAFVAKDSSKQGRPRDPDVAEAMGPCQHRLRHKRSSREVLRTLFRRPIGMQSTSDA